MLLFDWLIHSNLILASCRVVVFVPVFCGYEINLKTKIRKKKNKQTAKVIYVIYNNMVFFSELSKRDFVRSTLTAEVLLQLKFSRPFTNVISFKALNLPFLF